MVILYIGTDRSIIINYTNKTFKFYEDNEVPHQDYCETDYQIERLENYVVDDLKGLAKACQYKEIK